MQATDSKGLWSLSEQQRSGQRPQCSQQRLKGKSADYRAWQYTLQGAPPPRSMAPRPENGLRVKASTLSSEEAH